MKLNEKRISAVLERHEQIMNLVEQFAKSKTTKTFCGDIRIQYGSSIEEYRNTACHCHPEYQWQQIGSMEEFYEWLKKQQSE
jgi:hypothetical protein